MTFTFLIAALVAIVLWLVVLLGTDNYLTGTSASVKISTTAYSFRKWKLAMKTSLPKITNFTTSGYQLVAAAVTGATLTLEAPYNQGNMAFTCGNSYAWILGFTAGVSITVTAFIETLEADVDVEREDIITITAQSSGTFTAAIT